MHSTLRVLGIGFVFAAASVARAATIVAPSSSASTTGNAQGPAPLRFYGTGGSRVQQVYDKSLFASSTPLLISAIQFRPFTDPGSFSGNTVNVSDVQVRLSTTSRTEEGANQLSTTFADNVGLNAATVYSGALTLTTAATGSGPKDFDYTINFQTPFAYTPALGNLLLDVLIPTTATVGGNGLFGFVTFDSVNTAGDGVASVVDINNGAATIGQASTNIAISKFTFTTVPVPEPASALLALPLLAVLLRMKRRASRQSS